MTWPSDRAKSQVFQICILGTDPFGGALDSIVSGQRIGGKKIEVKRLTAVQQTQTCMVLFVSSPQEGQLPAIFLAARNFSLLTVSDMVHFAERGGDIGLVVERRHLRFEINCAAAEQDHLVVGSELLKLASKVIGK